jgi:hypothetical protein
LRNRSEPTLSNLVSLFKHPEVLYHLLYMMGILVVRILASKVENYLHWGGPEITSAFCVIRGLRANIR